MHGIRIVLCTILPGLMLTAGACRHEVAGPGSTVATVTVTPSAPIVTMGTTMPLTATLQDTDGVVITGPVVHWTSSDTAIATVSSAGVVTGVAVGSARIAASAQGTPGIASVTVKPVIAPVDRVDVDPSSPTIRIGQTVQLRATLTDADGNTLTDRAITWSTSDADNATVSATGLVRGVDNGKVVITATSEGTSGHATVTIEHRHGHHRVVRLETAGGARANVRATPTARIPLSR